MAEALKAWQDFREVNDGTLPPLFEMSRDGTSTETHYGNAEALDLQAEGLNLSVEGRIAFRLTIQSFLRTWEQEGILESIPPLGYAELAAYMGMIVGLKARELADEADRKAEEFR